MKTLYLDLFSGISGDMFLGAIIDLGVDQHRLEHDLEKLGLGGYHLHARRGSKCGIAGIKFDVHLGDHHGHAHDHGHDHGHASDHDHAHHHEHAHSHEHDHGHSHAHSHEHGHDHEHGHAHGHEHEHEHAHDHHHDSRDFAEIRRLIETSTLSDWVKRRAVAVFHRVAVAEGKIHGQPPEKVHFHEVGAVDSIVDIVGACIGLEMLGCPRVVASGVVEGSGWVNCAHGRFPIPAPATLEIFAARGVTLSQCEEPHELVTPTGAALLAEFAESFGPMHGLKALKIGYGLGTRDNKTRPNVLRAVLGEAAVAAPAWGNDWETDTVAVLETNLDDCTAELIGYVSERAFAAGALDVFTTPAQMKKNRPGTLLTVLCAESAADTLTELLLRETSAFGVRRHTAERRKLRREQTFVRTPHGEVEVKLGLLNGAMLHAAPEFESCRKLALEKGVPLSEVYEVARRAAANPGLSRETSSPRPSPPSDGGEGGRRPGEEGLSKHGGKGQK